MTVRHTMSAVAVAALLAAGAARAADASATINVSANVARVCTIVATPIVLGTYDPITPNATNTSTGDITVQCTKGTSYDLKLDDGANANGGTRRMKHESQAEYLTYQLYSDEGHQTAWNTTTFVTDTAPSRAAVTHTVYALVPAEQNVPEGAYKDSVSATIIF